LVVVPPLAGHVNPTIALAARLQERGHVVSWVGCGEVTRRLLPEGATVTGGVAGISETTVASIRQRSSGLRGAAALKFLWEDFLFPLASAMLPAVDAAVEDFAPDLVVVDQQALAGAVVARRREVPWATSATTSAELVDPFAPLPKVGEWVRRGMARLAADGGLDAGDTRDLRFSEHLVLAFTTEALTGPLTLPPGSGPVAMVGPSLEAPGGDDPRHGDPELPAGWMAREEPRVLVSLGTVNAEVGATFMRTCIQAVADEAVSLIMVAPPELLGPVPGHVVVRRFVPQLSVLAEVDAVVSHAGHNTVCEALAYGRPLVVAPIRDDQPIVAEQVVRAGAGRRVRFGRVRAPELREVLDSVLFDDRFRSAAAAVQRSFSAAGGAEVAADRLLELLA
jgi:UDP:flavonoid glycosyltransferase YjiC (YdhE family)